MTIESIVLTAVTPGLTLQIQTVCLLSPAICIERVSRYLVEKILKQNLDRAPYLIMFICSLYL